MRPPTDFEILKEIYERYSETFAAYDADTPDRAAKLFVPIDIPAVAEHFGVDRDIIFGRLYYHLQPKYGQESANATGGRKGFFVRKVGTDVNAVNFPLLEAVLAGLWQERRRDLWTLGIAVLSIGIALAALIVSIVVAIVS